MQMCSLFCVIIGYKSTNFLSIITKSSSDILPFLNTVHKIAWGMCRLRKATTFSHKLTSDLRVSLYFHLFWHKSMCACLHTHPFIIRYYQLRARRVLSIFNDVPLRTRRVLSLYKVYGDSALLVLNGTSLNSNSALLTLNWWSSSYNYYLLWKKGSFLVL